MQLVNFSKSLCKVCSVHFSGFMAEVVTANPQRAFG